MFESKGPVAQVARDLGIHKEALRQWVRQTEADSGRRRDLLSSEAARVQRELTEYANLSQSAMQSTRIIAESLESWKRGGDTRNARG